MAYYQIRLTTDLINQIIPIAITAILNISIHGIKTKNILTIKYALATIKIILNAIFNPKPSASKNKSPRANIAKMHKSMIIIKSMFIFVFLLFFMVKYIHNLEF